MADFTVPNYSDLIDNLNTQIASGPPKVDFSQLGQIPDAYYAGQKNKYDQRLRNLFSGGVPTGPDGSPDYTAMSKSLLQAGGASEVPNSISLGNAGLGRQILGATGVLPPSSSNMQPSGTFQQSGSPSDPRGLRNNNPLNIEAGNFTQSQPGFQGSDGRFAKFASLDQGIGAADSLLQSYGNRGLNTVSGIVNRWAPPGENDSRGYAATVAKTLGVDPNQPIDLTNPSVRKSLIGAMAQVENGRPLPTGQPQGAQQGGMMPAVVQSQPPQQVNPQTQAPFAQPSPTPTQNVPNQPTETLANAYEARANYFYQQEKGLAFVNKDAAAAAKAQGDQAAQQALEIRKSLNKSAEPTPEQKNTQASGAASPLDFERRKEIQKTDVVAGQKQYEGIQAQATQYERDLKPYLDISKSIINDPKFYSGVGGQLSLDFNRVRAALGDKDAAVLQEALQKVTAASVLSQINNQRAQVQEAGGASSRIFRQQVDLVEKAAPALANTPAGNRFLVQVSSRMGDLSSHVAQMARDYKQQNGVLDSGFDAKLSDYMKSNPVFTKQELTHPETLGAPTVPPGIASNPQELARWAQGMGLKPGDAIRAPDGRVKSYTPDVGKQSDAGTFQVAGDIIPFRGVQSPSMQGTPKSLPRSADELA